MKEITERLKGLLNKIEEAVKIVKLDEGKKELAKLETEASQSSFWQRKDAKEVMQKIADFKKQISEWGDLKKETAELLDLAKVTSESDHEVKKEITQKLEDLEKSYEKKEFQLLFSGKHDKNKAILSIYAGAGGIEAADWAEMLLRMYLRFAERQIFLTKIIHITSGEEAGIKSVTVGISGPYSYGYLKSEAGVHRLVRLSPFDADKARHTSFALVDVIPEIEEEEVKIAEEDLRIETFRARGHGGQSVNTTDSAVRITHLPTKIQASCQNERSQLQNKEVALRILRSKLHLYEEEKKKETLNRLRGETISAEWGNQIRSYVLHPYSLVKDHRTGYESKEPQEILDGKIDGLIESYLRKEAKGT